MRRNIVIGTVIGVALVVFGSLRQAVYNVVGIVLYAIGGAAGAVAGTIRRWVLALVIAILICVGVICLFVLVLSTATALRYWPVVAAMFVFLGVMSFLFFRAVKLVPGSITWGTNTYAWTLPARMSQALGTLMMSSFFFALMALAALQGGILPTLTPLNWLMIGVLALFMGAYSTAVGTSGNAGRWIMKWGAIGLVAAAIILPIVKPGMNPVLTAGKQVVIAVRDRSVTEFIDLAIFTQPDIPARVKTDNFEFQKQVIQNEITRHQAIIAGLNTISAARTLKPSEINELETSTVEIAKLQVKMGNLGQDVTTQSARQDALETADEKMTTGRVVKDTGIYAVVFDPTTGQPTSATPVKDPLLTPDPADPDADNRVLQVGQEFRTWTARPAIEIVGEPALEVVLPNKIGDYVSMGVRTGLFIPVRKVKLHETSLPAGTVIKPSTPTQEQNAGWFSSDPDFNELLKQLIWILVIGIAALLIWNRFSKKGGTANVVTP